MKLRYLLNSVLICFTALPTICAIPASATTQTWPTDVDYFTDSNTNYRYYREGDLWYRMEPFPKREAQIAGYVSPPPESITIQERATGSLSGTPYPIVGILPGAFEGDTALKSVTFAEDCAIDTIGANAFKGTSITEIRIPSSVKVIGENAFADTPLETVHILAPDDDSHSVSIGDGAFSNSPSNSLKTVYVNYKDAPTISENVFPNASYATLVYPKDVSDDQERHYHEDTGWKDFFNFDVITGIDKLETEIATMPKQYYTLSGVKVTPTNMRRGIYIVKQGNNVYKMICGQ